MPAEPSERMNRMGRQSAFFLFLNTLVALGHDSYVCFTIPRRKSDEKAVYLIVTRKKKFYEKALRAFLIHFPTKTLRAILTRVLTRRNFFLFPATPPALRFFLLDLLAVASFSLAEARVQSGNRRLLLGTWSWP